jgi:hypothetical protein
VAAVVNAVMNLRLLYNVWNLLTGRGPVGFSGRPLFHGVSQSLVDVLL